MIHHELPSQIIDVNHAEETLEKFPYIKDKFFNFFSHFNQIRLFKPQWEPVKNNRIALVFTARVHPYFVYLIYYAILSLWRYSDLWLVDIIVQCDDSQYELGKKVLGGLTSNIRIINPGYACKMGFPGDGYDTLVYFDADAFMYGENFNLFRSFLGLRDIQVVSNYKAFNGVCDNVHGGRDRVIEELVEPLSEMGWLIQLPKGWDIDFPHTCFTILPLRYMPQDWPLFISDYCKFENVRPTYVSDEMALYLFGKSHRIGWKALDTSPPRELIRIRFEYHSGYDGWNWIHPWSQSGPEATSARLQNDERVAEYFHFLHDEVRPSWSGM
jgi:hypothetical protein